MVAEHRVILLRGVKPKTPAGWLSGGKRVGAATTANASKFTSIAGLAQRLASDTAALDEAEAVAKNGSTDDIAARNLAWRTIKASYRAFVDGVQGLCDIAPDAEHARAIAAAAGIDVKLPTVHYKDDFHGKARGRGTVHLYARRPAKYGRYYWEWQMSTDGATTWTTLAGTNAAHFLVENLTPGMMPSFRCRSTAKNTTSAWSQTIVLVVV